MPNPTAATGASGRLEAVMLLTLLMLQTQESPTLNLGATSWVLSHMKGTQFATLV